MSEPKDAKERWTELRRQCEHEYAQSFGVPWDMLPGIKRSWSELLSEAAAVEARFRKGWEQLERLRDATAAAREFLESVGLSPDKSLWRRRLHGRPGPEYILAYLFSAHSLAEVERVATEATGDVEDAALDREAAGRLRFAMEAVATERGRNALRDICVRRALYATVYTRPSDAHYPKDAPLPGIFRPGLTPGRIEARRTSWLRARVVDVLDAFPLDPDRQVAGGHAFPSNREIALVTLLLCKREDIVGLVRGVDQVIKNECNAIGGMRRRRGEVSGHPNAGPRDGPLRRRGPPPRQKTRSSVDEHVIAGRRSKT